MDVAAANRKGGWAARDRRQELGGGGGLIQHQQQAWLGEPPTLDSLKNIQWNGLYLTFDSGHGPVGVFMIPRHAVPTNANLNAAGPSQSSRQLPMHRLGWVHLVGQA